MWNIFLKILATESTTFLKFPYSFRIYLVTLSFFRIRERTITNITSLTQSAGSEVIVATKMTVSIIF